MFKKLFLKIRKSCVFGLYLYNLMIYKDKKTLLLFVKFFYKNYVLTGYMPLRTLSYVVFIVAAVSIVTFAVVLTVFICACIVIVIDAVSVALLFVL